MAEGGRAAPAADWPLTGREEELAFAAAVLSAPDRVGVVLAGAAGVGKTRLAREVLARAERDGYPVRRAAATRASAAIPFGALAPLLPDDLPAAIDTGELFQHVRRHLVGGSGGQPMVVGVDDAHLLDDASAAVVHQLAVSGAARLVLTVRTGEATPSPVTALWKDALVERLEVQALSVTNGEQLLRAVLGGRVEQGGLRRLWALTGGNALFVREVVLDALEAGTLTEQGGVWLWERRRSTATRLAEVIDDRLGALAEPVRRLVLFVALGEPVPLAVIDVLCPPDVLAEAGRLDLVKLRGDPSAVQLTHPLYGDALRARLSALEARALYQQMVAAHRRSEGSDADPLRLATWELECATMSDPAMFVAAAAAANDLCDFALAERLARAALPYRPTEATLALGQALNGLGRFAAAEAAMAAVEGVGAPDRVLGDLAYQRAVSLRFGLDRPEAALDVLRAAEAAITSPQEIQRLHAERASTLCDIGDIHGAMELALPILTDHAAAPRPALRALVAGGTGLSLAGRGDETLAHCERLGPVALGMAGEFPPGMGWVLAQRIFATVMVGRLGEAESLAKLLRDLNAGERDDSIRAGIAMTLGIIVGLGGRVAEAADLLAEAVAMQRRHDPRGYLVFSLAWLGQVAAQQGDVATAAAAVAAADDRVGSAPSLYWPEVETARAWLAATRGELSDAGAILLAGANGCDAAGFVVQEGVQLHTAVRLGLAPSGAAARLDTLAARADGVLVAAFATHVDALARGDAAALDAVAADFEAAGALLLGAEAYLDAARLWRSQQLVARAARSAHRGWVLAARCPGATTPGLTQADHPVPLTAREREIAVQAATGRTNRAIADALTVSVRTVENHLQATYAKLGLHRRDELAVALGIAPEPT